MPGGRWGGWPVGERMPCNLVNVVPFPDGARRCDS